MEEVVVDVDEVVTLDDEGTVVLVVVVVAVQSPQQLVCVRTRPWSSVQWPDELSMSHFGGSGQSLKVLQNFADEPTHREWRTSQMPKRGSAHATEPGRPQVEFIAQPSTRPAQRRGSARLSTSRPVARTTHAR